MMHALNFKRLGKQDDGVIGNGPAEKFVHGSVGLRFNTNEGNPMGQFSVGVNIDDVDTGYINLICWLAVKKPIVYWIRNQGRQRSEIGY